MGNTVSKCSREDDGEETGGLEMFPERASMQWFPGALWRVQHDLDKYLSPRHADDPNVWKAMFRRAMELFEQSEEEETRTMKEDVMMFLTALRNAARYGRMSGKDGHLLMEWAIQRSWVITGEMEVFLMDLRRSLQHGLMSKWFPGALWRVQHDLDKYLSPRHADDPNVWKAMFRRAMELFEQSEEEETRTMKEDVMMCLMHLRRLASYDGDELLLDRKYRREFAEIIHQLMENMGLGSLAAEVKRFLIDEACTPPATRCWESTSDPTNEFCESLQYSIVF